MKFLAVVDADGSGAVECGPSDGAALLGERRGLRWASEVLYPTPEDAEQAAVEWAEGHPPKLAPPCPECGAQAGALCMAPAGYKMGDDLPPPCHARSAGRGFNHHIKE